ncbi:MAG: carbon monoxide dehydrogenase [Sulfobacillus benefaciens]|uniref:Carbon monoxide dehydrogenase n=1 Tax=Sulfobacillus benefaciens TaxID=453960 RepID=A0A2T2XJY9_9FIRM|nr:MAG: carbon monoxide dehydrogenase [Sulfobacillus benefaciens]
MEFDGHKTLEIPMHQSYTYLTDPAVLIRTMPGVKSLVETDSGVYRADVEWGVAPLKGKYHGSIRIVDANPPKSYRMIMEGQGPKGEVAINLAVTLTALDPETTDVHFQGNAESADDAGGFGQRVMSGVAQMVVSQFFSALVKEAKRR